MSKANSGGELSRVTGSNFEASRLEAFKTITVKTATERSVNEVDVCARMEKAKVSFQVTSHKPDAISATH
jgi:hypothetical protein